MYTSIVLNRSVIRRMILESDPTLVREVKPADLTAVAKACRKGSVSHRQGQRGFIYPGKYFKYLHNHHIFKDRLLLACSVSTTILPSTSRSSNISSSVWLAILNFLSVLQSPLLRCDYADYFYSLGFFILKHCNYFTIFSTPPASGIFLHAVFDGSCVFN
jgi:hypothetical protein